MKLLRVFALNIIGGFALAGLGWLDMLRLISRQRFLRLADKLSNWEARLLD